MGRGAQTPDAGTGHGTRGTDAGHRKDTASEDAGRGDTGGARVRPLQSTARVVSCLSVNKRPWQPFWTPQTPAVSRESVLRSGRATPTTTTDTDADTDNDNDNDNDNDADTGAEADTDAEPSRAD